ncbi:MocR-like pyridoxine biosynthesis transcription factor PdxR [Paenibacillus polymyxa]|uniref:MocR-like pyridoxine biosynthesis transcription factor PdxR n=1 Tax=Paenibacillus polymyxa TaxID=1406 RepID=UPI0008FBA8D1|nr:PLP-dependent aminotransferase family protein [Paenibacillus polymyxa]APB77320.1 transcriptional regulator PtsJ [Paenibacillus polymyxa]POR24129.1 PLP-dependent aminotransferase family protein [Paenibacillus polymyxa]
MHIYIQRNNGISITRQIVLAVIDQILSGFLQEGEKLPSVRVLSKQLNVSLLTVVKAYRELEQQNFLYSVQGSGTFVRKKNNDIETACIEEPLTQDWQLSVPDYLPRSQLAQFHHVPQKIHLASSMVDPELLPNRHLKTAFEHLIQEDGTFLSRYGHTQGDQQLRLAMQQYLNGLGVYTQIENLLVTNGSQQGIDLIARTFVGPGDVVILEAPTYPGAIDIFRNRGVTILTVPLDQEGMRLDILQQLFDKHHPKLIYTIPNFHNPTGVLMSHKRRRKLLEMAQNTQTLIIEDDPWAEIYYDQHPPAPIKSMDEYGHVIYLKGLSKILAPGCRIGVLSASGSIFKRVLAAKANADLGTPLVTQKILLPFLEPSIVESHMQNLRTTLKIRRDLALEILSERCPKEVSWMVPQGGLNLWLSLPEWVQSHLVLAEANKKGISFLPGSSCFSVEHENHHIRLSFSFVSQELLREGITTLCEILAGIILSRKNSHSSPYF